ncbi:hypothetical protein GOP47_0008639 [Adiantum capillus-veneris]|uniref:non-specific serine/threonine protein kinase n=1 Tax=Adiantum capillus-veneris TaxID=13818 RepID=A0A9D4UZ27_ADICA|nr:hypothetical protein GOP47_0008639 [Adiantum capillus-veneris]
MWRLKQLIPKEQAGLEGKTVEVGSLRLQIRSVIAEGGFSSVYLARDAQSGKQFAVKHIMCNDTESIDLIKKEVNALKTLRGHPNIITLHGQAMYDMGRTKECFIVTEYCDKMMVEVLDSRGAGFFEEKQLLLMFRDICNAVYALHCLSPPMAHRDLKAENLLLGTDGLWKLCDFGSISTNHRRFEKAAEMGIEEDIIRKHTTPAYRAPEMWDLYSRELINEKVDIWALGCLLYRMAYLKSAFDGDSKLQILNGNYRIPDQPKYSASITGLIKEMLNSSPEARPTVLQVWQRVNSALPVESQKTAPDKAPSSSTLQDNSVQDRPPSAVPTRTSPIPHQRSTEQVSPSHTQKVTQWKSSSSASKEADLSPVSGAVKGGGLGSFWATQYAQEALHEDNKGLSPLKNSSDFSKQHGSVSTSPELGIQRASSSSTTRAHSVRSSFLKSRGAEGEDYIRPGENEVMAVDENANGNFNKSGSTTQVSQTGSSAESMKQTSQEAFNEFVADFQKASVLTVDNISVKEEGPAELERLRSELKRAKREREEFVSKYEKLVAMCRSQRLEIQELKAALLTANSQNFPAKGSGAQIDPAVFTSPMKSDSQMGTNWDLQQGKGSPGTPFESQGWKAFADEPLKKISTTAKDYNQDVSRSDTFGSTRFEIVRPGASKVGSSSERSQKSVSSGEAWGLLDSFATLGTGFSQGKGSGQVAVGNASVHNGNTSRGTSRVASTHSNQPSGWSNF